MVRVLLNQRTFGMKDRSSVSCDDECCAAVATDNGGGGSGLIDDCEDVTLPQSHPPSTLLTLLQSCGGLPAIM